MNRFSGLPGSVFAGGSRCAAASPPRAPAAGGHAWLAIFLLLMAGRAGAETPVPWKRVGHAIPKPLGGLRGDPARGRQLVIDRRKGNCLACHHLPIPEAAFQGTIGPPLHGIAARLSEGEIRLRVVDQKQLNPMTIMPGYYRDPALFNRVADEWLGRTVLGAQEVEDIVAWLLTLKEPPP